MKDRLKDLLQCSFCEEYYSSRKARCPYCGEWNFNKETKFKITRSFILDIILDNWWVIPFIIMSVICVLSIIRLSKIKSCNCSTYLTDSPQAQAENRVSVSIDNSEFDTAIEYLDV